MKQPQTIAQQLQVIVNPQFDHGTEPEDQEVTYVSPVRLANELVRISNVMGQIAAGIAKLAEEMTGLKRERRLLSDARASLERELLRDIPLSPAEAKSLKTIEAAVSSRAMMSGKSETLDLFDEQIQQLSIRIDAIQAKRDVYDSYQDTAHRMTDNLRTVLSYQKQEWAAAHGK